MAILSFEKTENISR